MTKFKKFFEESRQSVTLTEIKKRYETCGSLYDKYVHVQRSIEEIVEETESKSSHAAHLVEFEKAYFNIMSIVEDFIENTSKKRKECPFIRS